MLQTFQPVLRQLPLTDLERMLFLTVEYHGGSQGHLARGYSNALLHLPLLGSLSIRQREFDELQYVGPACRHTWQRRA